jgi:hypothetical protein
LNFLDATERRKEVSVFKEYLIKCCDVDVSINKPNVNINTLNADIGTQSKGKEKEIKPKKHGTMENVSLSEDEFIKLQDKFQDHEEKINNLSLYISSKGDKYKSHYATILSWDRKDKKENNAIMQPRNKKEVHDETRERFARELLEAGDTGYKPDYRRNEELEHKI